MLIDLLYHGKFPAAIFATGVKEHDEGNLPLKLSWVTTLPSFMVTLNAGNLSPATNSILPVSESSPSEIQETIAIQLHNAIKNTLFINFFIDFLFCKDKRFFMKSLLLHHETRIERKYRTPLFSIMDTCHHCRYLRCQFIL